MYLNNEEAIKELQFATGMQYSDEQLAVLKHNGGMCIMACAGSGKALTDDTKVLTPDGYTAICCLKVGDKVFGLDGKVQEVEGVYPQGFKDKYEVTFSDGNVIPCCDEHLWTVRIDNSEYRTMKLGDIIPKIREHDIDTPITEPIEFNREYKLPIKPYLMGIWVTSGILSDDKYYMFVRNKNESKNIIKELKNFGEDVRTDVDAYSVYKEGVVYSEIKGSVFINKLIDIYSQHYNKAIYYTEEELNKKFIPQDYLYASVHDRMELAKSIIDNGGNVKDGKIVITSHYKEITNNIVSLFESLGMVVLLKITSNRYHSFSKTYTLEVELPYHLHKWFGLSGLVDAHRYIAKIAYTGEKERMTCIKVSNEDGLFLTEHCIVTHNTTILTHLIAKRCLTGEIDNISNLLCTTYSKAGKQELQARLVSLLGGLGLNTSVSIKTIHATYLEVLKHFGMPVNNICTEGKKNQLIDEALREMRVRLEDEEKETVSSLLSYQVNNLMTDTNLVQSSAYTLESFSQQQYSELRTLYNNKKQALGLTDFDDLQMYMYSLMVNQNNQQVIDYCRNKYKYVYVDEFQDTSKIQFAILRKMVSDPKNLVVIGDDDQSIYGWRGADPSIILNVCGYFDIKKYVLSTNYRCCGEIVKLAAKGIKNNINRVEKDMQPYNQGGTLKLCDTPNSLLGITKDVYIYIKGLLDKGVKPNEIVVLCRNNRQSSILANMLIDNDIYYKTVTDAMKFTKLPLYRDIKAIFNIVDTDLDAVSTKQVLWKLVPFIGIRGSQAVTQLMESCSISLRDSLWHIIMSYTRLSGYCEKKHSTSPKIPPQVEGKVSAMAYSYLSKIETQEGLIELYDTMCMEDEVEKAIKLIKMYCGGIGFQYKNPDRNRLLCGVTDYVIYKLRNYGLSGTVQAFKRSEVYDNSDSLYDDAVELSTIHGAKGREWKYVILLADDNVSFPNLYGIIKMKEKNVTMENIDEWLNEERRLHYVAFTRAKVELAIFANRGNLSLFTLECLGMNNNNSLIIDYAENGIDKQVKEYSNNCYEIPEFKLDLTEQRVVLFGIS